MTDLNDVKFGRLESKERSYEEIYSFKSLMIPMTLRVETILKVPTQLRSFYNQGNLGACVGYSSSWMMSIYNNNPQQKYDAIWLYHQAQLNDDDPYTMIDADNGTYVWSALKVLQKQGHKKIEETKPDINDGIKSYYWCRNANDIRTALALGRPVVIGIPWYNAFMFPQLYNGEYWIGRDTKKLGQVLGGHAICIFASSDRKQAVKLVNSWGQQFPFVNLSYSLLDRLLSEGGEACVSIDNPKNS
jgi:hypothetical protein